MYSLKNVMIEQSIHDLLLRSGSGVCVQLDAYFPGGRLVGGKYSMEDHMVTMYIEVIKEQCLQMFSSLEYMMDYLKVVFAHELGHAEDRELSELAEQLDSCSTEKERTMIALKIEENAWEYAKRLLPEIDEGFMQTIIFYSLQPYRERLEGETA